MFLLKVYFKILAILFKFVYKLLYMKKISFGKNTSFRKRFGLMIDKSGLVTIGDNCFFNNDCSINFMGNVKIGKGSIFGENVKIYDHNHKFATKN